MLWTSYVLIIIMIAFDFLLRHLSLPKENKRPGHLPDRGGPSIFSLIVFVFLINMMGRIQRPLGALSGGILFPILGAMFFNMGLFWSVLMIPFGAIGGLVMSFFGPPLSFSSAITLAAGCGSAICLRCIFQLSRMTRMS